MLGTQFREGTVITWRDTDTHTNQIGRIVGYVENAGETLFSAAHTSYIVKTLANDEFTVNIDDPTVKKYVMDRKGVPNAK